MGISEKSISLLGDLTQKLELDYLSDLRYEQRSPRQIADALKKIPAQFYPCHQWNDAIIYLTNQTQKFDCSAQVKDYLIAQLLKPAFSDREDDGS